MHDYHAGHGIRAVHQRGRTFHHFNRVNCGPVNLNAVLVAPLLPFLSDAIVHHQHAVVAQSTNDGLRDTATGRDLRDAGMLGNGVDNVGRGDVLQLVGRNHADGRGYVVDMRGARQSGHHHFVQMYARVLLFLCMAVCTREEQ